MTDNHASVSTSSQIVEQIKTGKDSAVEELYNSLRTVLFFFRRQIGRDRADDAYHDLIINLVLSIRNGALREPESLPAYAMTIARRKVCERIREMIRERQAVDVERATWLSSASENPEQAAIRSERQDIAQRVLSALPPRDRGIIIRFYLNGESEEEIRAVMGLSHNQFRLIKSRTKMRYTELVKQRMHRVPDCAPARSAWTTHN